MYKKIIIFIIIFFFVGCNNSKKKEIVSKEKTEKTEKIEKIEKTGNICLSMRMPETLNPILNEDITVDNALKLVFEHLFILDEKLKPIPNLVSNIKFEEDSKSAILHLREDLFWQDGNKLTTEDIAFTLDTIKNYKKGLYKDTVNNILNYKILDIYNLKINFINPTGCQGYDFCFPIIPKHYYKDSLNINSYKNFKPLGNGPFVFKNYRLAKELNLVYNNKYFKGEPYIRNVDFIITPSYDTDIYSFEQEIIDVLLSSLIDWNKHSTIRDINLIDVNTNYFDFIGFNFNNSMLQKKEIREALAYIINKKEILEKAYLKKAIITNSPINPKAWFYEKNLKKYEYDVNKAKSIFEKEDYKFNEILKCLQKNNKGVLSNIVFKILVNEENNERVRTSYILKENLQNIGIIVNLIVTDYNTYLQMLKNKDFDIFIGGFNLSYKPMMDFAFSSLEVKNGQNFFSYINKDLDNILLSIKNSTTEESYVKNIIDFQKHISENLPIISIAFRKNILLIDNKIKCNLNLNVNNIYNNINKWFILDEQKV